MHILHSITRLCLLLLIACSPCAAPTESEPLAAQDEVAQTPERTLLSGNSEWAAEAQESTSFTLLESIQQLNAEPQRPVLARPQIDEVASSQFADIASLLQDYDLKGVSQEDCEYLEVLIREAKESQDTLRSIQAMLETSASATSALNLFSIVQMVVTDVLCSPTADAERHDRLLALKNAVEHAKSDSVPDQDAKLNRLSAARTE